MKNLVPERLRASQFSIDRITEAVKRRWNEMPHSIAWHSSSSFAVKNRKRIRRYKNKHRGEICVIIGNGPSLKNMDLSPLKNIVTFGLNRIYLLFGEMPFVPTYHVVSNDLVIDQFAKEISDLKMPKFLNWNRRVYFDSGHANTMFLKYKFGFHDSFGKDITKPIFGGATVTFVAMQIAYYMGFNEVVLIGVDHSFVESGVPNTIEMREARVDKNHFHPDYFPKGIRWQLPDLKHSELAYALARQAFENDGRRILDATVDGNCPVFERVDFEIIFG